MITNTISNSVYRWVITTLVGLLCFSIGYATNTSSIRSTVIRDTVRIDTIERSMVDINRKLDTLLMRVK